MQSKRIEPHFTDLKGAAKFSGYSKRQLYQFIRDGVLPGYLPAGKLLIDLNELTTFIKSAKVDPKTKIDRIVDEVLREVGR